MEISLKKVVAIAIVGASALGAMTASADVMNTETGNGTANATFEIECVGAGGRDEASVTVSVNPAAPRKGGAVTWTRCCS